MRDVYSRSRRLYGTVALCAGLCLTAFVFQVQFAYHQSQLLAGKAEPSATERLLEARVSDDGAVTAGQQGLRKPPLPPDAIYKESTAPRLTRKNLLIAIPTSDQHFPLIESSRTWRKGIRTLIAVNSTLAAVQHEQHRHTDDEAWRYYPDDAIGAYRGLHAGDTRAAVAPALAHHVFGDNYNWLLYGDDDTAFFIDNVLELLAEFDPESPYFITDNLWWSSIPDVIGNHPNVEAPRCLPCHYSGEHALPFRSPIGCPCTPRLLCSTQQPGIFNDACDIPLHPHRTYSMHGGAGALLSVGLLRILDLDFLEDCIAQQGHAPGGDAFITICLWQAGFAHTNPGRFSSHAGTPIFDPLDDTAQLLALLTNATFGAGVGAANQGLLDCMVSAHIRSRTTSVHEAGKLQKDISATYHAYCSRDRGHLSPPIQM